MSLGTRAMMARLRRYRLWVAALASVLCATAYGVVTRLAFGSSSLQQLYGTLTLGFLFLSPVALGAIAVAAAPRDLRTSWLYAATMPAVATTLFGLLAIVFSWEVWICVVMALPLLRPPCMPRLSATRL